MPKTVLVVEDEEHMRVIFSKALSSRGYNTLTANHGAEGVHLARTHRPDLILMDVRMPVMDGWGALGYLKAYDETRAIPVCGVTGHPLHRLDQIGDEELRFDSVLVKPVEPQQLVALVEERIGSPD